MAPKLALLACMVAIAVLLATESSRSGRVSPGMLVPLLWFILSASKSLEFWIHGSVLASTAGYKEGSPIDRDALILLMSAGLFLLTTREALWGSVARANRRLIALFLIMALSIAWSHFHVVSAKRWFRSTGDVIMALVIVTDEDPVEALRVFWRRSAIVMLPLSLLLVKYFRAYGVSYDYTGTLQMWSGVTTDKNTLGLVCAFTIVFLCWDLFFVRDRKTRAVDVLLMIIAAVLLMGSKSSRSETSLVDLIFGLGFLLLFGALRANRRPAVGIALGAAVSAISVPFIVLLSLKTPVLNLLFGFLGRNATFTGREFLWQYLLAFASHHRLLGSGYGGYWIGNAFGVWTAFPWGPTQAHNGYIDVYLQLGLVGLAVFVGLLVQVWGRLARSVVAGDDFSALLLTIFAMILIHNATETSFLRGDDYLWTLFLVCAIFIPRSARWTLAVDPEPAR